MKIQISEGGKLRTALWQYCFRCHTHREHKSLGDGWAACTHCNERVIEQ